MSLISDIEEIVQDLNNLEGNIDVEDIDTANDKLTDIRKKLDQVLRNIKQFI